MMTALRMPGDQARTLEPILVVPRRGGPRTDAGGIPAYGNQRDEFDAGCHPAAANPEHR
jgi:hypothetical protein